MCELCHTTAKYKQSPLQLLGIYSHANFFGAWLFWPEKSCIAEKRVVAAGGALAIFHRAACAAYKQGFAPACYSWWRRRRTARSFGEKVFFFFRPRLWSSVLRTLFIPEPNSLTLLAPPSYFPPPLPPPAFLKCQRDLNLSRPRRIFSLLGKEREDYNKH